MYHGSRDLKRLEHAAVALAKPKFSANRACACVNRICLKQVSNRQLALVLTEYVCARLVSLSKPRCRCSEVLYAEILVCYYHLARRINIELLEMIEDIINGNPRFQHRIRGRAKLSSFYTCGGGVLALEVCCSTCSF